MSAQYTGIAASGVFSWVQYRLNVILLLMTCGSLPQMDLYLVSGPAKLDDLSGGSEGYASMICLSVGFMQEAGKSRYDFDTEEQWQQYKANREANPKAAYQFGLKRSEGRKAHKNLGKQQDQKISNQLNKIKGILEKDVSNLHLALGGRPPILCWASSRTRSCSTSSGTRASL